MNTCQCCGKRVITGVTVWTGTELVYRHYLCQDQLPRLVTTQPATTEQTWIDQAIGPRVVGGTYYNGYWGDTYTVEEIKVPDERSGWAMRVRWSDGHTTIHCTAWDARRDSVVATPTVPDRAPEGMLAVRVGSDPWTMVPLDNETNPAGWDVIDTSAD